ncbi:ribonucleases P/MRP protein subunit POP1-domain-containing protein [Glomus cerebriforme]|uniref:Ribonucleases P/MRP protein subunit POP1-domain-containing protein n=1 Tax=Glomus cerebriforme TaxID=658196 RepID=A0A397TQ03_9GLOM|nr:ribonucleases P/MRP protein subunit POP1-domain-containing protein [Glomus cerebriforme]
MKKRASNDNNNSKDKKRAKTVVQRTIEIHGFDTSSKKGTKYIPRTIDVVDFAEARAFEINAMNDALERANQAKNSRAAQTLPRHLRRRAASHNVKRLPVRLRKKAMDEMESDNTALKKQSRRKRRRPGSLSTEYKRRQGNKKWLETHMWHSKRMKMTDKWGYKLVEHPNEKSIKASYRASEHLSIIHDASYFEWIKISGDSSNIISLFKSVTDPTLPSVGSERYLDGKRQCSTFIYAYLKYPNHLVTPINLIWMPNINTEDNNRYILIWIHPSTFKEALTTLEFAREQMKLQDAISIQSLQDEFLMFELTGPRSTALLQEVLDLYDEPSDPSNDMLLKPRVNIGAHKTWKALRDLRTSTSLPPSIVLGLTVLDPRLRFPKKVPPRTNTLSVESERDIQDILANWPENVAYSDLWSDNVRNALYASKISDGDLDKRRSKLLVPGQKLLLQPEDSLIPIFLIQRDGNMSTRSVRKTSSSPEFIGGWNIILPAGWGMSFWKSFIFAGAWVGGLRERHNQHFESGISCFPYDFPGTKSFENFYNEQKKIAELEYNKRPPAKRPNFKKLQVDSPFEPPFYKLVGIDIDQKESRDETREKDSMDITEEPKEITPWLLQGIKHIQLLENFENSSEEFSQMLYTQIMQAFNARGISLESGDVSFDLSKALVRVRVEFLARGLPGPNAIIYKADKNKYDYWINVFKNRKNNLNDIDQDGVEKVQLSLLPSKSDIIGYVTTGQFSFSQGHGFAIGCCSVTGILDLLRIQRSEEREMKKFVLVRKITSLVCQPATLEFLS